MNDFTNPTLELLVIKSKNVIFPEQFLFGSELK